MKQNPDADERAEPGKRLVEQLAILIGWKSRFGLRSGAYRYLSLADRVEPHQYEVQSILDAHPGWSGESAIEESIELARQALMTRMAERLATEAILSGGTPPSAEQIYVPRRYTLAELLKPPLTAFGAPGVMSFPEPDMGDWEPYDLGEDFWGLYWNTMETRLGEVTEAWYRSGPLGEIREIIERWAADFWRPEERESDRHREAECCYRYPVDDPDNGLVYPYLWDAVSGEGGVPLSAALADGLTHGLVLPEEPGRIEEPGPE
jgi:hypothetical protein